MSDEIKEILREAKEFRYIDLNTEKTDLLLDYITNLQEEIHKKEAMYDSLAVDYRLSQEENERLKELCDKYEEEHSTTFEYWKRLIKEDYKSRCEKAIEYINEYRNGWNNWFEFTIDDKIILLNILGGDKE